MRPGVSSASFSLARLAGSRMKAKTTRPCPNSSQWASDAFIPNESRTRRIIVPLAILGDPVEPSVLLSEDVHGKHFLVGALIVHKDEMPGAHALLQLLIFGELQTTTGETERKEQVYFIYTCSFTLGPCRSLRLCNFAALMLPDDVHQ